MPNISKIKVVEILKLLSDSDISSLAVSCNTPEYLFWDKVKYKKGKKEISPEKLWAIVKFLRTKVSIRHQSIVKDEKGRFFTWMQNFPQFDYFFHQVDLKLGGRLILSNTFLDERKKMEFISRGVLEEAIASSQLEGANTTHKEAKQMILEQRKPRTISEKMIYNNYQAMKLIESEYKGKKLNLETLLYLHSVITKDTLENPKDEGRLRTPKDNIVVQDAITGEIHHRAPSALFVKKELKRFINYANDDLNDTFFVHPVIKAIILHFWLAYLHPFVDGNGRMARLIFYWYVLKSDYWAFSYIPFSKVIKKSPAQYANAFVYTETDENDLTYFIDYNVRKILQAIKSFEEYVKKKEIENQEMRKLSRELFDLNERQLRLLQYFYKNKNAFTSIKVYKNINEISRLTAMSDLKKLEQLNFLTVKRIKRKNIYFPTEKVSKLFKTN